MKITKSGDSVKFRFRVEGEEIRRVVSIQELMDFLVGKDRQESNLPDDRFPVKFAAFVAEKYLPRCAKPNLKHNSYERELDCATALTRNFGESCLHKIDLESWEAYKAGRLNGTLSFSRKKCANSTVDKEFDCLRRVLNYAVQLGLVKRNPLLGVKGLKNENRREIWLRRQEIERLLGCCPKWLADLLEFRVLTGARPGEAVLFGKDNLDWPRGEIWIHTLKKRKGGLHKRYFSIATLGARFEKLLRRLEAHPESGLYFADRFGKPLSLNTVEHAFQRARKLASMDEVTPYDLRGTFAMHRAMVVKNFRQLQTEMGHSNPNSIQSYLDEASRFRKDESIFYDPEAEKTGSEVAENGHKNGHLIRFNSAEGRTGI